MSVSAVGGDANTSLFALNSGVPTRVNHEAELTLFFAGLIQRLSSGNYTLQDSAETPVTLFSVSQDGVVSLGKAGSLTDLKGSLNVVQAADFDAAVTMQSTLAVSGNVTVGGGYGSTGVTISDAGVLQMDGALTVGGAATFGGDVNIAGNLSFTGPAISIVSEEVLIADNHLFLNAGYTTAVAQTGGLAINYLPTATATTVAAGGFTIGLADTSNPTVAVASETGFAAGDLIQISDAADVSNNGLFEVQATSAGLITIRGIGLNATTQDFVQNQFITSAGATGAVTKVSVSILRAGTDGLWESANGSSTTGLTFVDFATASNTTLQAAYDNGQSIATDGSGAVVISGSQKLQITASGGLDVDGAVDIDGGNLTLDSGTYALTANGASSATTSAGALTITSAAAATWSTTAGDLTILAGGNVIVESVTFTGAAVSGVSTLGMTGAFSGATSGTFSTTLDVDGATTLDQVTINTTDGTFLVNGSGAIDFDVAVDLSAALTLSAASATITHSGGTGLVISSTSGYVDVESVRFTDAQIGIAADTELLALSSGALTVNGTIAAVGVVTVTGDVMPASDSAHDLGSDAVRWANGYFDKIYAAEFDVDVNGTNSPSFAINEDAAATQSEDAVLRLLAGRGAGGTTVQEWKAVFDHDIGSAGSYQGALVFRYAADNGGAFTDMLELDAANAVADFQSNTVKTSTVQGGALNIIGGASLTLTSTAGTLTVNAAGRAVDIDSASYTLDTTEAFSIAGASASNLSVTGAGLTVSTLTSGVLALSSAAGLTVDAVGLVAINSSEGSVQIGNDSGSTVGLGAGLNVSTTLNIGTGGGSSIKAVTVGSGNSSSSLTLNSGSGLMDINAGSGGLDIDVAGVFDMLSTGVFTIEGTGASAVKATGDLSIQTLTSGVLYLQSAGLKESKASHGKTGVTAAVGQVMTYNGAALAVAGTASNFPAGLCSATDSAVLWSTPGEVYLVKTATTAMGVGTPVYWAAAGEISTSAPTSGNIWRLGYVHTEDDAGEGKIVWMPAFVGVA